MKRKEYSYQREIGNTVYTVIVKESNTAKETIWKKLERAMITRIIVFDDALKEHIVLLIAKIDGSKTFNRRIGGTLRTAFNIDEVLKFAIRNI